MADDDDDDNDEGAEGFFQGGVFIRVRRRHAANPENQLVEIGMDLKTNVFNIFAIKAFQLLPQTNKNHIISPLNLIVDLCVLMVGSNGESYTDLRTFLDFDFSVFDNETLFKTIQTVYRVVNYERYKMVPNYHLLNMNRVLLHQNAKTSERFKIWIKRYFNVDIDRIDFNRDGHLIRDQITELLRIDLKNEQIQGFQTIINDRTQLMTLSAAHFIAKWQYHFEVLHTNSLFYNNGTIETYVDAMSIETLNCNVSYNLEWDASIIELPLAEGCMNFYFILPKKRTGLSNLLKHFTYVSLMNTLYGMHLVQCRILVPKLKLECDYDFGQQYSNLKVFTKEAELQPIAGEYKLKVNNMLHKVIFETNEKGQYNASSQQQVIALETKEILIEHPFLFVLKDARTGTFVFVGKVQSL